MEPLLDHLAVMHKAPSMPHDRAERVDIDLPRAGNRAINRGMAPHGLSARHGKTAGSCSNMLQVEQHRELGWQSGSPWESGNGVSALVEATARSGLAL
jgi:hypothetical protein